MASPMTPCSTPRDGWRRRAAACAMLTLTLALGSPGVHAQSEPVKRALLIGIDEYQSPTLRDLAGAGNDVELLSGVLRSSFDIAPENMRLLRDEEATREAILDAIREHLIEPTQPGDIVILHYSGHGARIRDTSGDEIDGWDETIVPHDSRLPGVFDITDDEINGLLRELTERTPHVTFILDSCHSGSGVRAAAPGVVARQAPADLRTPPPPAAFAAGSRGVLESPGDFHLPSAPYVLISGSRANELSNETTLDGRRHGVMSYFLAQALRQAGHGTTYRDLLAEVGTEVTAYFSAQHPQIEGGALDTAVFGVGQFPAHPYFLVNPDDAGGVTIAAGEVFGLRPAQELEVFPAGTKRFDGSTAAVASVVVREVGPFESTGSVASGTVTAHSRTPAGPARPMDSRVGVYFDERGDPELQQIRRALHEHETLEVVDELARSQLRVRRLTGSVQIVNGELEVLHELDTQSPSLVDDVVRRLAHWGRWYSVLAIRNPAGTLDLDLQVHRVGTSPTEHSLERVTAGTQIRVVVRNDSPEEIYVTLLDLAADGSITVLHPLGGTADALAPGGSLTTGRLQTTLPPGRDRSADVLKLIATTQPLSPDIFRLGPVPRSAAPEREHDDALTRYLRRSVQGLTRNLQPVTTQGWATRHRPLVIVAPTVRSHGVMLHVSQADEAQRAVDRLNQARATCGVGAGTDCYELRPVRGDPTMLQARTPAAARGAAEVLSVGDAFEEAYRLRRQSGAARAEPVLDVDLAPGQGAPHPASAEARGSEDADDPRAAADPDWSLKHVRIPEAWTMVRELTGATPGAEADGILVAHPDTGYRRHPEIWSSDAASTAVLPEKGYDYLQDDHDPTDDLLDSYPVYDNPGHGTGSGSAIVSPVGCQLSPADSCPTGPAPGARLIPLRINRTVMQFNTGALTQAILDAAGDERSHVKSRPSMVSMSVGGFPSWSLWKAVTAAEERGLILVAAAGNYVRTVVWPARFDSVIAVAATNVGCSPWVHSSRGPAVDISAPGESVWRASLPEPDRQPATGMGTGTTYATATTAGVVALWLARHAGSPELESLVADGRIVDVLREQLRDTAWQPGTSTAPPAAECDDVDGGWDTERFGAGIIDAAALVAHELEAPVAPRAARARNIRDLPLWRSLYPPQTDSTTAQRDYFRVFGREHDHDALEEIAVYEAEILYHYTASEEPANAIDQIVLLGNRAEEHYARARATLLRQDLSASLREALQ